MPKNDSPVLMPVLSPGRHRNPRRGACFMEFASWLAGETWSDRPACTHPALASLARLVNDCSTDRGRGKLIELIPSVIDLSPRNPFTSVLVAVRAARSAIPIASEERQRAIATGLLCFRRHLHGNGDATSTRALHLIDEGLESAPAAARWARDFARDESAPRARDISRICEAALRISVVSITEACVSDPDSVLRETLAACISDLRGESETVQRPETVRHPQTVRRRETAQHPLPAQHPEARRAARDTVPRELQSA